MGDEKLVTLKHWEILIKGTKKIENEKITEANQTGGTKWGAKKSVTLKQLWDSH